MIYNSEDRTYVFNCPHCGNLVQVAKNEVNCTIFRHAIMKDNREQINPHSSKEFCDMVVEKELVYGCAKPFRLISNSHQEVIEAVICDYI